MTNSTTRGMFSWGRALFVSLCVGLLVAVLSIFLQTHGLTVAALIEKYPQPVATTSVPISDGLGTSFEVPGKPVRLLIPAIGIDANIQSVGLAWQGNGTMGIPTNFTDVGWYKDGPLPGEPGSAVIDGHFDGKDIAEAVFYNLDKLQPGDTVDVVDEKGKTIHFRVIETKNYDYDAQTTEIFARDSSKVRLNLITCAGDWEATTKSYNKRIVVFTELITTN